MADQTTELSFNELRLMEVMTPQERFREEVFERVDRWLKTGYRDKLRTQLHVSNRDEAWKMKMSGLGRDLALGLYIFALDKDFMGGEEFLRWKDRIWSTLFDTMSPKSVINCLGENGQQSVKCQLLGPISVLTFRDLVRKTSPGVGFKLSEVVADPHIDVRSRVDLILSLGDRDVYGHEIVRLIQLKTNLKNLVCAESLEGEFGHGIRAEAGMESMRRIRAFEEDLVRRRQEPISVRSFLVTVPEFESAHIRNPFGIIQSEKSELVGKFKSEAITTGLLPTKQ